MEGETAVRTEPIVTKLESDEFKSIFNDSLHKLIDIFKRNNFELRIAGGAVRDLLLRKKPVDIDFATVATPTQMKKMFEAAQIRMINENGAKHGTITPRIDNEQFEVTTLRIDVQTNGRHAEVEFTTDWQVDANRRDLTINSMFVDFEGNVYDYFYGYDDLVKRRVAFVGAADQRIREDYLRILRYFRFYGRTADRPNMHEAGTLKAIADNVAGLKQISGERIWAEVKKILVGRFGKELMLELIGCGAGPYIGLPEQPNIEEFKRVYEKNDAHPANPITLLSALLNNEPDAFALHQRLRLSAHERDNAIYIILNREATMNQHDLLFYQKECFNTPNVALRRTFLIELLKYNGHSELVDQLSAWTTPVFPLNGQLLQSNGCPQGKEMGDVALRLRELWKNSSFQLDRDELLRQLPDVVKAVKLANPSPPKKQRKSVKQ